MDNLFKNTSDSERFSCETEESLVKVENLNNKKQIKTVDNVLPDKNINNNLNSINDMKCSNIDDTMPKKIDDFGAKDLKKKNVINNNNNLTNKKNSYSQKNKEIHESKNFEPKNETIKVDIDNNSNNNIVDNTPEPKIIIGVNEKKRDVYISNECRYNNTLILGTKGTGKTTKILPFLVEQDLPNKDYGLTIITTKHDMAYNLYTLSKKYKRDVIMLKPSINNEISNKLLWKQEYNYDYINEYIINYKEAIKKRQIVIIDMEILKYKSEGLRAVAMLLLQLQLDIQETDITQRKPHFVYIDDAYYYLPFIEHLLNFSDDYNLGLTLFMQSRNQLFKNGKNYSYIVDNMVRNILLLNSLTKEDVLYYSSKIYIQENINLSNFYDRKANTFIYETIDSYYKRKTGIVNYESLLVKDWDDIIEKSKKSRMRLLKQKRTETERKILETIKEKLANQLDKDRINEPDEELSPEQLEINQATNELLKEVPIEQLILNDDTSEPTPIDLSIIDQNVSLTVAENTTTNDDKTEKENLKKIKQEKLKEIIILQEKEAKRKVSTNNFNKMKSEINYCNDDFDFTFE